MRFRMLLFSCLIALQFLAQDSLPGWNVGVRFNRLDFFMETGLAFKQTKITHEIGVGFGINRSVFQQRLFPEVFYGLKSNFRQEDLFSCDGITNYYFSFFQANREQSELHFFNELLIGLQLSAGRKNTFFFQPQIGFQAESFHSDFFQRPRHYFSLAYSAKIGFSHVF